MKELVPVIVAFFACASSTSAISPEGLKEYCENSEGILRLMEAQATMSREETIHAFIRLNQENVCGTVGGDFLSVDGKGPKEYHSGGVVFIVTPVFSTVLKREVLVIEALSPTHDRST